MNLLIAFGTRPEFVKLAPVVHELARRGHDLFLLATGQHYDDGLAGRFFADLGLAVDEQWELDGDEATRVGQMLAGAYEVVGRRGPDAVVVLGDTHTVPLFCLAARRHRRPVVHLEAGLRSHNDASMEEVNRRVAAATASLHLAPTALAARHLRCEGVADERIRVVGNPVLDAIVAAGVRRRDPEHRAGVVTTFHRASNVDDPDRLAALVEMVRRLHTEIGPVVFPIHPRTRARLDDTGLRRVLDDAGIDCRDPLPYREMLELVAGCRIVVTDSGGLQEEAAWLGVPVVVLRNSTPRWESVEAGLASLVGTDVDAAMAAAKRLDAPDEIARIAAAPCPYGDGAAARHIADVFDEPGIAALLEITEPSAPMVGSR